MGLILHWDNHIGILMLNIIKLGAGLCCDRLISLEGDGRHWVGDGDVIWSIMTGNTD